MGSEVGIVLMQFSVMRWEEPLLPQGGAGLVLGALVKMMLGISASVLVLVRNLMQTQVLWSCLHWWAFLVKNPTEVHRLFREEVQLGGCGLVCEVRRAGAVQCEWRRCRLLVEVTRWVPGTVAQRNASFPPAVALSEIFQQSKWFYYMLCTLGICQCFT